MDKRKTQIIILILLIALLLAIAIYFLWFVKPPQTTNKPVVNQPTTNQNTVPKGDSIPVTATPEVPTPKINVPPASSETIAKTNVIKMAESFAERLGSYSNQANFSNIEDLKLYMTASMKTWADKYIATNKKSASSGTYQGVTTKAVSNEVEKYDDANGEAIIVVHTQKASAKGTSSPVTSYQDITITLVKQNNIWLVDNAVWKK